MQPPGTATKPPRAERAGPYGPTAGWPLRHSDLVVLGLAYTLVFYDITDIGFGMPAIVTQFHLSDNHVKFVAIAIGLVGHIVGSNVVRARAPPGAPARVPFFIGFAIIAITGLLAGLIALGGPKTTGISLEKVRQRRLRTSTTPV